REKVMKNNILGFVLFTVLLAFGFAVEAQQPAKIPRIGYLTGSALSVIRDRTGAFREGLREFGYVDGKTILIEWKSAEGQLHLLPALARELVGLKVDVIVTTGASPTRAAKTATNTIPIVMAQDIDPVGSGFVASLARPGGNVTGLSSLSVDISGKRMELLREIAPKLSRVALLGTSTIPGFAQSSKEVELAAAAFGVRVATHDILAASDIEPSLRTAVKERADAILVLQSFVLNSQRKTLVDLATKNRLPGIYYAPEWVEDGGLISYGVSFSDMNRRVAPYVDKILKGAKPADLPVEQPTKFELVINLKTAKQIGLTIPPNVLARADRVIK
ncbi:MAG TPA: ABC transporter substrate-binding protein, partial [Candidatus Binatia bacterium]|nr:ABC transporter substrate-binding protein [Candidatus Binatia bacterium]